jgi:hypothetical protein
LDAPALGKLAFHFDARPTCCLIQFHAKEANLFALKQGVSSSMKNLKRAVLILVGFAIALLFGGSTYDYGLSCTKCRLSRHVVLQRCFGIPFFRSSTEGTRAADYEGIFGQPCRHVFRKGGFGRSSWFFPGGGCGTTAEGNILRFRTQAVATTFELAKRFGDKESARNTFAIIDRLMPPETRRLEGPYIPRELIELSFDLEKVGTHEDWLNVLRRAATNSNEKLNLPGA